jgi:hypothetical protein
LISLPSPSQVSPVNLDRLALTTLQELDSRYDLSAAAFQTDNPAEWSHLQIALAASLPANIVYNITVYDANAASNGGSLYVPVDSFSDATNIGVGSDDSSYLVASSNVSYVSTPQQISTDGAPITLYILNCSDTAGWWITGYTPCSLAQEVYNLLSPYFRTTIMVQNTNQLAKLLDGHSIQKESINNAVIINTCGEAVPIPTAFSSSGLNSTQGYDPNTGSYAMYDYTLGKATELYNWTWVSIVGFPFYYVTNTGFLNTAQNSWGIYGMEMVGSNGLSAFMEGLDNQPYLYTGSSTGDIGVVYLSSQTLSLCNYYGLYPASYQTSTRALPTSILGQYDLVAATNLFSTANDGGYNPGAVYRHWTKEVNGVKSDYQGGFFALGMARIPDIRLAALGILCDYQPVRYSAAYAASGSNRVVVLQLGIVGGS